MQLIADAVTVLGSRHGLMLSPFERCVRLIRFDKFHELPAFGLRAGLRIGEREVVFPLCAEGELFSFIDQRITPCTATFIGLDPVSGLKAKLRIVTPFRPRDAAFSTTPMLGLELGVESISGQFRWDPPVAVPPTRVELFVEVVGGPFKQETREPDSIDLVFDATLRSSVGMAESTRPPEVSSVPQRDRLVALSGTRADQRFVIHLDDLSQPRNRLLRVAWCTWSAPVFEIKGRKAPFHYTRRFPSLDAVASWSRTEGDEVFANAARVDALVARAEVGVCTHHLLAQTLHSWLACTWWADRDGEEWFSVWEGNCYFHSTVDVEFTQAPFYLSLWPELLGIELNNWPDYSRPGESLLGEKGRGTLFLSHDCGQNSAANGQSYPHDMEVEETANYVILAFCYSRRTGDIALPLRHAKTIEQYLQFLLACDSSGNGIADRGVANTIDDGSPAIQFGRQQTYLAVKTLAAFAVGATLARSWGRITLAESCEQQANKIRATLEAHAWHQDHFVVLLQKGGTLRDPWTGTVVHWDEIPGWDAPHIYTSNTLPLLDMVGFDLGLDPQKVATDLVVATRRCLREYGCVHTDFAWPATSAPAHRAGLSGASRTPGWISMNLTRDLAAYYRGIDLRHLTERYWEWQLVTNSRETSLFFETFSGNHLHYYPRGVVIWGIFDALGGVAIDQVTRIHRVRPSLPSIRIPLLSTADWRTGVAEMIEHPRPEPIK